MAIGEGDEGWEASGQSAGARDADANAAIPLAQTVTIYWAAFESLPEVSRSVSVEASRSHTVHRTVRKRDTRKIRTQRVWLRRDAWIFPRHDDMDVATAVTTSEASVSCSTAEGAPPETISAEIPNTSVIELAEMSMTYSIDAFWASLDPETSRVTGETVTGNHPLVATLSQQIEHRDRVTLPANAAYRADAPVHARGLP